MKKDTRERVPFFNSQFAIHNYGEIFTEKEKSCRQVDKVMFIAFINFNQKLKASFWFK